MSLVNILSKYTIGLDSFDLLYADTASNSLAKDIVIIISHAHLDHMKRAPSGTRRLDKLTKLGYRIRVYCSVMTRRILAHTHSNLIPYTTALQMMSITKIHPKVTLVATRSNHCPGSIMLGFCVLDNSIILQPTYHFFSADFRWVHTTCQRLRSLEQVLGMTQTCASWDVVYYDDTFANLPDRAVVPSAKKSVDYLIRQMRHHLHHAETSGLLVCDVTVLGTETLFKHAIIACQLGDQVYVAKDIPSAKFSVLQTCLRPYITLHTETDDTVMNGHMPIVLFANRKVQHRILKTYGLVTWIRLTCTRFACKPKPDKATHGSNSLQTVHVPFCTHASPTDLQHLQTHLTHNTKTKFLPCGYALSDNNWSSICSKIEGIHTMSDSNAAVRVI